MTDYTLEDTIYTTFTTRAFATGIPTTLGGTPVISAYENDNLTQITAGVTLGVDHDGLAGLNLVTVAATAANGFESGKDYNLVITTGTVSGVSVVGEVIGTFSIERSAAFTAVAALNNFDPAADVVANVTLVATTTLNSDMRGTDGANTLAPDNAGITANGVAIGALNNITAQDVLEAGDIDGFNLEESQRVQLAALGGELSGAATSTNIIDAADGSKPRITATVDADGNRTAVTLDASA